jgi:hypothetical protein
MAGELLAESLPLLAVLCMTAHMCNQRTKLLTTLVAASATFAATSLYSQFIPVPNFSFESQPAPNSYPFVNTSVDSWQKNPEPGFYTPTFGGFGIPWSGTAGVFLDVNPYVNHVGNQVGYLLAAPQVALFQDYSTSPTHDFNATFQVGRSYQLTAAIFGKSSLAPGSTLELSLYYLDALDNKVTVGSTVVSYSAAAFPTTGPLNLVDFSVHVPEVQAGDAWAGQHIGIQLASTVPIEQTSFGNWDFDNVRLEAVPEPSAAGLIALGLGGCLLTRSRSRRAE